MNSKDLMFKRTHASLFQFVNRIHTKIDKAYPNDLSFFHQVLALITLPYEKDF